MVGEKIFQTMLAGISQKGNGETYPTIIKTVKCQPTWFFYGIKKAVWKYRFSNHITSSVFETFLTGAGIASPEQLKISVPAQKVAANESVGFLPVGQGGNVFVVTTPANLHPILHKMVAKSDRLFAKRALSIRPAMLSEQMCNLAEQK